MLKVFRCIAYCSNVFQLFMVHPTLSYLIFKFVFTIWFWQRVRGKKYSILNFSYRGNPGMFYKYIKFYKLFFEEKTIGYTIA
jgi:hypothetical protein